MPARRSLSVRLSFRDTPAPVSPDPTVVNEDVLSPKRGRGRPRKHSTLVTPIKRGPPLPRGRPRKSAPLTPTNASGVRTPESPANRTPSRVVGRVEPATAPAFLRNVAGSSIAEATPATRKRGRPPSVHHKRITMSARPTLTRTVDGKPSPMKTRRLRKSTVDAIPHCTLCKKSKGELKGCSSCHLNYHLRKCLLQSDAIAVIAESMSKWKCPKCERCATCSQIVDDMNNRECRLCLRAWHGKCAKGTGTANHWTCNRCSKGSPKNVHIKQEPMFTIKIEEPDEHFRYLSAEPSSRDPSPTVSPVKRGRGRPKGSKKNISTPTALPKSVLPAKYIALDPETFDDATNAILDARSYYGTSSLNIRRNTVRQLRYVSNFLLNTQLTPRKKENRQSRSPEKKIPPAPKRLATDDDIDTFEAAKRLLLAERLAPEDENVQIRTSSGKWVYMGADKMKALYDSPYSKDILRWENIFICPFCLHTTGEQDTYRIHQSNCNTYYPPGYEIYRDDGISFFEVSGADEKAYCRNLCLLSKMFISSKTLHHEVDTFLFYILTELTPAGCRIVGYFSKEKNPSKNNNLSCLLTLPSERRKGYGRLLIDMSYELSRLEHKVGSPEHPLSDLGLFAYRDFWRASILCYLRSMRNTPHTSIKHMALSTRIHPTDIVNQLMRDKLLIYRDGNYFVKTGKRAYKWPLSICRRRGIDRKKLIWSPSHGSLALDQNKLNYYV